MPLKLPEGMSPNICEAAARIGETAIQAGWTFTEIAWLDQSLRMLEYVARNPAAGTRYYTMCGEDNLTAHLMDLVKTTERPTGKRRIRAPGVSS